MLRFRDVLAGLFLTAFAIAVGGTVAGLIAAPAQEQRAQDAPAAPKMTPPVVTPNAAMPAAARGDEKAGGDRPAPQPGFSLGGLFRALLGQKDFEFTGRVVNSAGRPVAGARIYLSSLPEISRGTTGPDGRFKFTIRGGDEFKEGRVIAVADGLAPGAASRGFFFGEFPVIDPSDAGRELTITLTEDQPIEGRVFDLEGRPVAGASVRVTFLFAPTEGDLTPWLKAVKAREAPVHEMNRRYLKRVFLHDFRPTPTVKTDAQGRFTVRGLGRDRLAYLEIKAPTIRPLEVQVLTRRGEPFPVLTDPHFPQSGSITYHGASPQLSASPSRPIEGIVRDKETRKPIAGAIIQSTKLADGNVWNYTVVETTSDAQGRYRLIGMPPGSGNVIVAGAPPGQTYLPAQIAVDNPPGLSPVTLDIDLPKGVVIEGKVTDLRTGKPVAARVVYHAAADNPNLDNAPGFRANTVSHGSLLGVDTAPDGRFQIAGLGGRGALVVETRDRDGLYPGDRDGGTFRLDFVPSIQLFHQALVMIDVPQDVRSYGRNIALDPGRALEGAVVDPEGKPLDGAQAYGLGNLGGWENLAGSTFRVVALQPAKDDAKGKPTPARSLVFLHPSRKLAGWVDIRGDEPGPLRVALAPWSTARGQLVDPEGRPRPDVTLQVSARRPRLGGGQIWHEPQRVRTDADGHFRIEGLAPGLPYQLAVQAPPGQRAGRRIDVAATAPGETRDLGTIAVEFRDQ